MMIRIDEIRVKRERGQPDERKVGEIADSIRQVGLLNPITVDRTRLLIAGLYRLEAVKRLGWTEVECTVTDLEGLMAELAELDENFVRFRYSTVEHGEMLLRRKEIYEILHPETRNGGDRKSEKIRSAKCTSDSAKSFVEDTAEKLGVNPSTVRRQVQAAKNLTPEAKGIIRDTNAKLTKKDTLELSRMEPGEQKEAAEMLAAGEIHSLDEYIKEKRQKGDGALRGSEAAEDGAQEIRKAQTEKGLEVSGGRRCQTEETEEREISIKEIAAELKDMDKDCSATPESFLMEFKSFVERFHRGLAWYRNPYFDKVYPRMSEAQTEELHRLTDSICGDVEDLYDEIAGRAESGK